MCYSLQTAKELKNAIVKVQKARNKLLFYEASNLLVPTRIILTQNLKSINVINFTKCYGEYESEYLTQFYYHNDTKVESLFWKYEALDHNWEKETTELINKTIQLV